jgi:hypothetical protein
MKREVPPHGVDDHHEEIENLPYGLDLLIETMDVS